MGRPFIWKVQSRSDPSLEHTVSWVGDSMDSGPVCTCKQWAMKNRKHFAQHGENFICAHLQAAKDTAWREMIESVKEQLLAQ